MSASSALKSIRTARDAERPALRPARQRVLFLNRSYWPDVEATGQLLTELCEDLAGAFDVTVIAGQPNQNPTAERYRTAGIERRGGVTIHRVLHWRFPKQSLVGRVANLMSYLFAAFAAGLSTARPAVIVAETDPPLLSLLGKFLKHWHGCRLVLYLQDIYPDVALALGKLREGPCTRWLRVLLFSTYRRADRVVVLSEDMKSLLVKSRVAPARIALIPNWVDTMRVYPVKTANPFRARHGIDGEFVVMYSGNLGLSQRLQNLLAAANRLRQRPDILFLVVGDGASKLSLEQTARRQGLSNVRFLPYQPQSELAYSLSAADLHWIPLDPRVASCLMPSKLYGALASGTAVLAAAPESSELRQIVSRNRLGLVVAPDDPEALAGAIHWSADHRREIYAMGANGRACAVEHYDRHKVTAHFAQLVHQLTSLPRATSSARVVPS